jgi:hypothetical protein
LRDGAKEISGEAKVRSPAAAFSRRCHADFGGDSNESLGDYIPRPAKADPARSGIAPSTVTFIKGAPVRWPSRVQCLELPLEGYAQFRDRHPQVCERIVRNLAALLAKRLIVANKKIDLLASY